MSPALSPVKGLVKTWKALGAPSGAGTVLASGPQGPDLARAVQEALAPGSLTLLHPDRPPPRARFDTIPDSLTDLATTRPGGFDLILAGGGLETGDLSHVRDRLVALADLLAPAGVLALAIDTLAAPVGADFDALLFPHLARAGELGEDLPIRAPLPAAGWMLLIRATGLELEAADGLGGQTLPRDYADLHGARLAAYDPVELTTGTLRLILRKPGDAA
ncbi:hypothetical protein [Brevundimonas sp.]|uniref:hypothetical protein n=1 Tax=Brevundimonas sp. TaxID=1871086 RepID=UPI001DFE6147|nr:hypothetical protein [Brevundimonas sp.]MBA3999710.1 hypothetical protein [Brevundimonas sp.]